MVSRKIEWLFVAVFTACVSVAARGDCTSENVAGYITGSVKRGDNTFGMPKKMNGDPQLVSDVLGGLVDGDAILVVDRWDEQHWGRVSDDGEEKHVYVEGFDDPVDDWRLPSIAGEQVFKVKRTEDVVTQTPLAGEFNCETPLQLPEYSGEAPLSKIRLGRETVKNLQTEVTVTNDVSVPFPVIVSKKFEMILKDGRSIVVQVDPNTRVIVDVATGKPVNVGAAEISGFAEIKNKDIPESEKADAEEIRPVVKDVAKGTSDYDIRKAVSEGVIGAAWDGEHKWQSILWGLVVVGVLSLLNKIFDKFWDLVGQCGPVFLSACWCVAKAWWLLLVALCRMQIFLLKRVLSFCFNRLTSSRHASR